MSEVTITTTVGAMKAEYAGCGTHLIEVELTYQSEGGAQFLAKELRLEADRLDPQQFEEELAAARHAIQEVARLRRAIQDVIAFQFIGGEMLKSAVSVLESVYEEVQHCEG